jgi:hypothetical protein
VPVIYVAASKTLSDWGASVGISKNLYKVGVAASGKDAIAALNAAGVAGASDWKLMKATEIEAEADEDAALARLAKKEPPVDPRYYPRLKGEGGIFRVKPKNVENAMLVEKAMAGEESLTFTLKPADIANYLIKNALA